MPGLPTRFLVMELVNGQGLLVAIAVQQGGKVHGAHEIVAPFHARNRGMDMVMATKRRLVARVQAKFPEQALDFGEGKDPREERARPPNWPREPEVPT